MIVNNEKANKEQIIELSKKGQQIAKPEDIIYVPLGNDYQITDIEQVVYFDNEYFMRVKFGQFFRFSDQGKYLNQIGKRGAVE